MLQKNSVDSRGISFFKVKTCLKKLLWNKGLGSLLLFLLFYVTSTHFSKLYVTSIKHAANTFLSLNLKKIKKLSNKNIVKSSFSLGSILQPTAQAALPETRRVLKTPVLPPMGSIFWSTTLEEDFGFTRIQGFKAQTPSVETPYWT